MSETLLLDDKIIRITQALDNADCPYAFGGAIALAYYAAPRGTENIDLNLFVSPDEVTKPLAHLERLGIHSTGLPPAGDEEQLELHWDHTPIHVFLSYDPFHESCRTRSRRAPFSDGSISILSGEDIAIFKTIYDREKDRTDVREILLSMSERLDIDYVLLWLTRILGDTDPRIEGFRAAVAELVAPESR
jgi:hypothetical protein